MVEGNGSVMMHRAEFHGILLSHIPKDIGLHKLKRLVSYSDPADDGALVRLFFADGTQATCDVLVGADGIRSAVRATMLNELAESTEDKAHAERLRDRVLPRYSGVVTHRIVLPREKFSQLSPDSTVWTMGKLYLGDGVFIVTYPVSQGRLLNVAVTTVNYDLEWTLHPHPWVSYLKAEELLPLFEGWAQEARGVIAGLEGAGLKKWVINVVNPLDEWSAGRVTLLGDAAHGMVPFQGAGAGQAIEDVHILSTLLSHPRTTRQTVQHALRAYSDVRVPIAAKFFAASRKNGLLITNTKTPLSDCAAELRELADSAWCSSHPEVESRRAVEEFEAALVGVV
ncbi:unnamed protein product [Peniophora sp. CBMAI 1063]|nr:unnamed protein product [Peniophora sp. CBMAI 1063]